MFWLKQSTSVTVKIGPFLDETNGKDAETTLTITQADVRLSKNGGDIAQKTESTSCTHDELGIYGCPLDTTDTGTLGRLQLFVHENGALPVWHDFMVVPANVFDSLVSGSDKLDVNAAEIEGADPTDTIRDSVVDDATLIDGSALNTLSGHDPGATLGTGTSTLTQAQILSDATPFAGAHIDAAISTRSSHDDPDPSGHLDAAISSRSSHTAAGVWAVATRALTDKAGFSLAADQSGVTVGTVNALGTQAKADVDAEVDEAIVNYKLDHLVAAAENDDPVNDSIMAKLAASDGDWSGFDKATDSLEAIRDAMAAGEDSMLLQSGTITVTDQTHFTLSAGSGDDDAYLNMICVITDQVTGEQKSVRTIIAYVGGTATVTLDSAPDFTIATGDGFKIVTVAPGSTPPTASVIADAVWDEASAGHTDAGKAGQQLWTDVDSTLAYSASAAAWGSINSGIVFRGTVTADDPGVSFTIAGLADQGAGAFIDSNTPWYAYVFRDAGGAGAAPQGEQQKVTGYTSSTGTFTTDAFSAAVATGDDVIIMSGRIAAVPEIKTRVEYALPDAAAGADGGLPTVDANNRVAGIQGTKTTFDALNDITAAAPWSATPRTLTSFGTLVNDVAVAAANAVWSATTRTLTDFGGLASQVADAVWTAGTRTLTSFGLLVNDVVLAVWTAGARTLTAFGFTVTTDSTSREASKADVSNLDVAVSTRSSHDAAAVKTAIEASGSTLDGLLKLAQCDVTVDTAKTPWELVVKEKGTATELLRKKLYQADGSNVTSADHLVARHTDTATE